MRDESFEAAVQHRVSLPYRVYFPDDFAPDRTPGFPLLVFLHGAGERGDDLNAIAATGLPRHLENGDLKLPFVTLCPQCARESWWDRYALAALLDDAIARCNVDPRRVYLTGLSMGGKGIWELADLVTEKLAAIVPICAPYTFVDFRKLRALPMWVFHGVMDSIIPVAESARMVRMLRAAGCDVRFTTYPDADHDSWTETYTNPALYEWLLAQRRSGPDSG